MTLVLNDDDVARVLTMRDCIATLEDAFREMGLGGAMTAPRRDSFMLASRPDAYYSFKTMEGGLESLGVVAQRINSDLITHPSQITLMNKNWGLGIEFASVAKLIYDQARAAGIGNEIPTEWFSQTSHP